MRKKYLIIATAVIILSVTFVFARKKSDKKPGESPVLGLKQEQKAVETGKIEQKFISINGLPVEEATAKKRPVAVMVENHPDSRPQSGLTDADLVYETLAEGGITRFMAVYQTKSPVNIGPIRSARTYFAELADELNAIYVHVGGNSDVLQNIKLGVYKKISNGDEFMDDGTFFHRIKTRFAPHNMYSSMEKLLAFANFHKYSDVASFNPWKFKDDKAAGDALTYAQLPAKNININFSFPEYAITYIYNQKDNNYQRLLAGKPHVDLDTKNQIFTKNIVVQFVQTFPVKTDTPLSLGMDLKSGGKAIVFLDGKAMAGTWKKQGGDRTRYYDTSGKEIEFNRGTTWVELVPQELTSQVSWK